uniref:Putative regulation of transcription n=1 Tax=Ixodes ricinus TaxID=34613 RepID=A0A6B0VBB7_IXORI
MVVRCCIPSCKRRTRRGIRVGEMGVSFHQFPSDLKLFEEWIKALNCEGFTPNLDCHRVCSDHFKQTDYIDGKRHRCLKRAAVPSIFARSSEDLKPNAASCTDRPELRKERGDGGAPLEETTCPLETASDIQFSCCFCNYVTREQRGIVSHLIAHANEQHISTQHCPMSFSTKCDCSIRTTGHMNERPLEDHLRPAASHENADLCSYEQVDTQGKSKCQLSPMSQSSQEPIAAKKVFQCPNCPKTFLRKPFFVRHKCIHTGEKPYKCPYCCRTFARSSTLIIHVRTHTVGKPYKCQQCNETFATSSQLARHATIHTIDKPFKCQLCPMSFSAQPLLSIHMQGHKVASCGASVASEKRDRVFKCLQCPKAFSVRSRLTIHMQGHDIESHGAHTEAYKGDRPYKCLHCPKAFDWSTSLAIHIRTHTGKKPYKC